MMYKKVEIEKQQYRKFSIIPPWRSAYLFMELVGSPYAK